MLRDPFPSSPMKPSCYSITAIRVMDGEEHARVYSANFFSCYAAAHWLRMMLGNEGMVRRGYELILDSGIKLRSYQLDAILAHEFTVEEERWHLPEDMVRMIARFRRGTWELRPVQIETVTIPQQREKQEKAARPKVPEGYTTITQLVKGTPVPPMNARALLRASNYQKPPYGWAFSAKDLPGVKKLLGL